MKLFAAVGRVFRRFQSGTPTGPYEAIAFGAARSFVAVAFFPPGRGGLADAPR